MIKPDRDDYRGGAGYRSDVREGAFAVRTDVTDQESIDATVSEVTSVGGLDILVNNAAVSDVAPIVEITREL